MAHVASFSCCDLLHNQPCLTLGPESHRGNKRASLSIIQSYVFFLPISLPAPKIVFNRLNGKKYHQPAPTLPADTQQEERFTDAHEENVKFVYEGEKMRRYFSLCQPDMLLYYCTPPPLLQGLTLPAALPLIGTKQSSSS